MGELAVIFEKTNAIGLTSPIAAVARVPGIEAQRCAIVYYSRLGACVSSATELPDLFIIRPTDSRIERICRVVWRLDRLIGVEYRSLLTVDAEAIESLGKPTAGVLEKAGIMTALHTPR